MIRRAYVKFSSTKGGEPIATIAFAPIPPGEYAVLEAACDSFNGRLRGVTRGRGSFLARELTRHGLAYELYVDGNVSEFYVTEMGYLTVALHRKHVQDQGDERASG